MDWTIDFSVLVRAGFILALAVAALSVLCILQVSWMRARANARAERLGRFREQWARVLADAPSHIGALPRVQPQCILELMVLWNAAQEATYCAPGDQSAMRSALNDMARRRNLHVAALRRLRDRDLAWRLAAIAMLGHLREPAAARALLDLSESPDATISFAAARAMLQIDAGFAEHFVTMISRRRDWSPNKLMTVIREQREDVGPAIAAAIRVWPQHAGEYIRYLRLIAPDISLPLVRELLQRDGDPGDLTACLKVLAAIGEPADAALAARFVTHEDWRVRVQAANVLGQLGNAAEVDVLTMLLNDEQWWVRYRAAEALGNLAALGEADLDAILRKQHDRFARDVVVQIMAESAS